MQFRLFLLVMFLIFVWAFDWNHLLYGDIEQKQFDFWYEDEFLPVAFQDTIQAKVDFSTYYLKRVHYGSKNLHPQGVLKLDYQTYDFIEVGDVLSKKAGSTVATVIKKDGKKHSFDLQYCKLKFYKNDREQDER